VRRGQVVVDVVDVRRQVVVVSSSSTGSGLICSAPPVGAEETCGGEWHAAAESEVVGSVGVGLVGQRLNRRVHDDVAGSGRDGRPRVVGHLVDVEFRDIASSELPRAARRRR
jgi:hypothetical protein